MNAFFRFLRNVRLVWWFVAALLALFVADGARAACSPASGSYNTHCATEAEAEAYWPPSIEGQQFPDYAPYCGGVAAEGHWSKDQEANQITVTFHCLNVYHGTIASGQATWTTDTPVGPSPEDTACAAKTPFYTNIQFPNGSVHCDPISDCAMTAINVGDGGQVKLIPFEPEEEGVGDACTTGDYTCPEGYLPDTNPAVTGATGFCIPEEGDADGDGIDNGEDDAPFEHGDESHDTDGDGVPDSQDAFPNDPDNGKDKEDGETANTSTGGGNCQSPPQSHGDAIGAQIAYQAWATRCAVDRLSAKMGTGDAKVTVVGGVVGGSTGEVDGGVSGGEQCIHEYNITGGDPINAQALVEAQRLRCQQQAQRTADEAGAGNVGDESGTGADLWQDASALTPDESGYGWDGGVPALSMHIAGSTYALPFAEERGYLVNSLKALVILAAAVACYVILMDV